MPIKVLFLIYLLTIHIFTPIRLALAVAEQHGLSLPAAAAANSMMIQAMKKTSEHKTDITATTTTAATITAVGDEDFSAVYKSYL